MASAIDALFRALSQLHFDRRERPSRAENLTDILEIVAVAAGLKPAHLNGEGFRSAALLDALDVLARSHRLQTLRTQGIRIYEHRKPGYDTEIHRWQKDRDEQMRRRGPDILWVYKEPPLEVVIRATVEGERDVAEVLGYPECCVRHYRESGLRVKELFLEKLRREHHPTTTAECIRLLQDGTQVRLGKSDLAFGTHDESARLFPYVQFEACPSCRKLSDSPAARMNRMMRDLAFDCSPSFGREIWRAQYEDIMPGLSKTFVGDEPCPCGALRPYKECCALGF